MDVQRDVAALDGLADERFVQRGEVAAEDGDDVDPQGGLPADGVG
jgi:hypothetical protein